jgi:hypothetical protein
LVYKSSRHLDDGITVSNHAYLIIPLYLSYNLPQFIKEGFQERQRRLNLIKELLRPFLWLPVDNQLAVGHYLGESIKVLILKRRLM